jgi:hypothetical protein
MAILRRVASLVALFLSVVATAETTKPKAQIGELLITAESVEEAPNLAAPKPGFHFVRVTGTITNVGKHALCTFVSATLETTFNLQSYAEVRLGDRVGSYINQLLPGERLRAEFVSEVKDRVEPLTLVVTLGRKQGCSRSEPLPVAKREARFSIASIQGK